MPDRSESPSLLLQRARAGEPDAIGRVLELYRDYLRLLTRTQLDPDLRVRLGASDLAQETLIHARRDFGQFTGNTERQLISWLRKILARKLANQIRHHGAKKRDFHRQRSLEEQLDRSSVNMERALLAGISSPSAQVARRERAVMLADALARLPADYREVIIMRHLEGDKFPDIAAKMGRTAGAVRMLWVRALERLRIELEELS